MGVSGDLCVYTVKLQLGDGLFSAGMQARQPAHTRSRSRKKKYSILPSNRLADW